MNEEATTSTPEETSEQAQGTTPETVEAPSEQSKPLMIPKERLDAEIAKRREYEKAAKELEALKQQQADAEAEKTGQVEKFKTERDQYKGEAEQWKQYATAKLEGIAEGLEDGDKAILEHLDEGVPLSKRLAIAEQLASRQKQASPGYGTKGGPASSDVGGLIPPEARSSRGAFDSWLASITNSGDRESMALLVDAKKRA